MLCACHGGLHVRPGQSSLTVGPYGLNLRKREGMLRKGEGRKESP